MGPRHVAAILGMLLLIAAFYTNRVFQAGFNPGEDLLDHEVPLARFFVDSILQGHFPQWNPHKACGLPACETPFMGPYYPSFLLYFVVPVEWAVNLGFVLHIGLSGWFFFLLSRQLGLSHLVAFFCASSWALSSEFQQYSESGWLSEAIATTYLPAVLWLIVRARGARSQVQLVLLMLAGGCMALSITGGHPLNSFFVMSSVVFFSSPLLRSGREIRLLGLLLLLVLLLSVVVWGPFLIQYFSFPSSQYDRQGYLPIQLLNFLLPTNIRRGFVGRPLLILAVAGLFLRRQPFAANFRVLLVISLGLSLAGSHRFFDHVPFFSGIRNTWQWHIGLIASLIVFSGFALTRLEEFLTRHFTSQWLIRSALFGLLALQLLDLYGFNQAFYPRGFTYSLQDYFTKSPITEVLRQDPSLFRIINRPYNSPVFRKNQGVFEGVDCFESRIRGVNLHKVTGRGDLAFDLRFRGPRPWADLCNVKYIIEHVEDPGHLKAYSEQAYRVLRDVRIDSGGDNQRFVLLENETCFPRVFLLTGANRQQVAQILRDPEDGLPDMISNEMFDVLRPYHAVSVTREIDRYRVDYSADQPGFLFLGEMYDAGWRARVDGAAAKITAPFGFFMGLHVPSGAHTVVFEYRPLHTYVFWLVSALTLVASVAITAVVSIKGRQDATARVR